MDTVSFFHPFYLNTEYSVFVVCSPTCERQTNFLIWNEKISMAPTHALHTRRIQHCLCPQCRGIVSLFFPEPYYCPSTFPVPTDCAPTPPSVEVLYLYSSLHWVVVPLFLLVWYIVPVPPWVGILGLFPSLDCVRIPIKRIIVMTHMDTR